MYLSPQPFFVNVGKLAQTYVIADKCKVSDKPESKHRKLSETCEIFNKLSHTKHVQKQCVYRNNGDIETNKAQKE